MTVLALAFRGPLPQIVDEDGQPPKPPPPRPGAGALRAAWPRAILHADLDAFFATAEIARRPELVGLPVIVGGRKGGRGVVCAASYPARPAGVRSGMSIAEAERRCPHAIFLPVDGAYYGDLARRFRAILLRYSPLVQMTGPDEAAIDVTGMERVTGPPELIALDIRRRVREELSLIVSIGLATGRTTAKIAAKSAKPDGFRAISPGKEAAFLAPLPVAAMPGIGPATERALHAIAVRTLGELARMPDVQLRALFGDPGPALARHARGEDDTPLVIGHVMKSVGHEHTLRENTRDRTLLRATLAILCDETATELRAHDRAARVVALRLRDGQFRSVGMQTTLSPPTNAQQVLLDAAWSLFDPCLARLGYGPVRLIGVRAAGLGAGGAQLMLLSDRPERLARINAALDAIRARHGTHAIRPALTLLAGGWHDSPHPRAV
ncbi:MAG: DNA polymerase IV [Thermomicrobia bacterium]|nr:DNA polymerase IV [Thermomicrobia bacterium]MCA1723017.1 DNA polymerase IV [Thermomicrobia bacterium]